MPTVPSPPSGHARAAVLVPAVPPRPRRMAVPVPAVPRAVETPHPPSGSARRSRRSLQLGFVVHLARWLVGWLLAWVLLPALVLGWQPVTIVGHSMQPMFNPGDVIMVDPDIAPWSGSVVTFADPDRGTITHRVSRITDDDTLVTRGDNNPVPDRRRVLREEVVGVGRLLVPAAGLPVWWLQQGRWIMVVLAAAATALLLLHRHQRAARVLAVLRSAAGRSTDAALILLLIGGVAVVGGGIRSQAAGVVQTDTSASAFGTGTVTPASNLDSTCTKVAVLHDVHLTWTPGGGSLTTGQQVQRSIDGGGFSTIATVGAAESSYSDLGITVEGTYRYRIVSTSDGPWTGTSPEHIQQVDAISC